MPESDASVSAMEQEFQVNFCINLSTLLSVSAMPMRRFVEETGISSSHICKIRRGDSSLTLYTLCRVAVLFGVGADRLLSKTFNVSEANAREIFSRSMKLTTKNYARRTKKPFDVNPLKMMEE
jgi:transcriptional regulator with XRE-family HTH domain